MSKRPSIGDDPLAAFVNPPSPRRPRAGKAKAGPETEAAGLGRRERQAPGASGKVRATFHLPAALVEEAKNAVVALSGPPVRLTLASLVRDALARELERLRNTHHKGKPWPPRSAPLVGGRPVRT